MARIRPDRDGLAADRGRRVDHLLRHQVGPAGRQGRRTARGGCRARGRTGTRPRPAVRLAMAGRDEAGRVLIAVTILASFVAFLDGSVVNLALPAISTDL